MKKILKNSLVLMMVVFLVVLFTAPAMIHADTATVVIIPEYGEIPALGQTAQYTAIAIDGVGGETDVTATATWGINDPGIATNNGGGLFTATAFGGTGVTATFEGVTGYANLWVREPWLAIGPGAPGEETFFYPSASGCNGLSWELVVNEDSTEVFSASGTIPSDDWWDHEESTTLSAGDYTATFSIGGTVQKTLNFSIWGFESSMDISVGYAGETTTFTLNATNSSGKTADFFLDKEMGDGSWSPIYDESIPIDSDDWSYTIIQTLTAGNYWTGFWIEDYWAGGYDFSVVNRDMTQPPVIKKKAPVKRVPAINEKPLSSYEKTASGFTTLFYNRFLRRNPEQEGLKAWTAGIESWA